MQIGIDFQTINIAMQGLQGKHKVKSLEGQCGIFYI